MARGKTNNSPTNIEDEKIKRNDKPFFYGVEITPKLQFTLQMAYMPNDYNQNPKLINQIIKKYVKKN